MPFMNNDRPEEILKRRILLAKAKLISNREYLKTILDIREKDLIELAKISEKVKMVRRIYEDLIDIIIADEYKYSAVNIEFK